MRVSILFVVLACVPAVAHGAQSDRAAVIALDDAARSRGLDAEAARLLEPTGLSVLQGAELDVWVREHGEPAPRAELLEKFTPATQTIAQGVEQFFYMSPEQAVPRIQPVFDLAYGHPEVLSYRPDLADQIWQAAIILVRAFARSDQEETARRYAAQTVALFPSRQSDPRVVPPEIRKLLDAARDDVGTPGATLRLSSPDPRNCTLYLNGIEAKPLQPYVVDPAATYFVRSDCSLPEPPPVWRVNIASGEAAEFHAAPMPPQAHRSDVRTPGGRRGAEWYLRAVAALADADFAVGVAAPGADEAVVLVRYDRLTGAIAWSDDDFSDSIRRGLPRIFPEYASVLGDGAPDLREKSGARRFDWVGASFVGAGLAGATAGVLMTVAAHRQSHRLDCAANNPSPPPGVDCEDVPDGLAFADFSGEVRKTATVRTIGFVLIGAGVGAVGYGIYRFVRPSPKGEVGLTYEFPATARLRW